MSQFFKRNLTALIVAAALCFLSSLFHSITKGDKTNDAVRVQESKQKGYESQPGYHKVSASWSKAWNDAEAEGNSSIIVLCYILCILLPFLWIGSQDGSASKNAPALTFFFLLIVVFAAPYVWPNSLKNSGSYEMKICDKDYQLLKANGFDHLFPEAAEQTKSLDDFLNSCR